MITRRQFVKHGSILVAAGGIALIRPLRAYGANIVAASPALSAVQAAVDAASNGDHVLIPNGSATWTSGITTTKQIIIRAQNYTPTPAGTAGAHYDPAMSPLGTAPHEIGHALFEFQSGTVSTAVWAVLLHRGWPGVRRPGAAFSLQRERDQGSTDLRLRLSGKRPHQRGRGRFRLGCRRGRGLQGRSDLELLLLGAWL